MGFSSSFALFQKLFEPSAETRLNSYAVPWKAFVPDLVATLTTPPDARPTSAVNVLVETLYSCTASSGIDCPTVPLNSLLFETPSSNTLVLADLIPLIAYPTPRALD